MDKLTVQKLKSLKILYAEDEDGIRENISATLKYYVHEVIEAKNGHEAYEMYQKCKPDIIYTDIMMPILNGVEFAKKVRENDKKTPIVMITAHTDKEYLLSAVELHLEQYIVKPVNLKDLKLSLEKCVENINENKSIAQELPDGYSYDFDNKTLLKDGEVVKLTKKEALFFELLMQNTHRVVSYNELQNHVWGDDVMTDTALKALLRNIRCKFPKRYIKNLSGVGYKLEV